MTIHIPYILALSLITPPEKKVVTFDDPWEDTGILTAQFGTGNLSEHQFGGEGKSIHEGDL